MFETVLLILSTALCIFAILGCIKSELRILWLPLALLLQLGACAFACFLLSVVGIGYSKIVCIVVNCVVAALAFFIRKNAAHVIVEERDGGVADSRDIRTHILGSRFLRDLMAFALIALIAVLVGVDRFGFPPSISFISSDAAYHWSCSDEIAKGGLLEGQFLSHLFDGILISLFDGIDYPMGSVGIFIFGEVMLLALSGLMLYAVVSVYCKEMGVAWKLVLCVLYILGYPLTNLIYGFSYLGICITVICGILLLFKTFDSTCSPSVSFAALSLLLFEVAISYILFLPVVFLAAFIELLMLFKRNEYGKRKSFLLIVSVFMLAFFALVVEVCPTFFVEAEIKPSSGIAREGATYRDLFSSFIFIAPLTVYGAIQSYRAFRMSFLNILTALFVAFTSVFLILCLFQKISTYYYFRMYFVLWLLAFIYGAIGIIALKKNNRSFFIGYACIWAVVFALSLPGFDKLINRFNPLLYSTPTNSFTSIYNSNFQNLDAFVISEDVLELSDVVNELRDEGNSIINLNNDAILRWNMEIYDLTDVENKFQWWWYTADELKKIIEDHDYVFVVDENPQLRSQVDGKLVTELLEEMNLDYDVYYENEAGYILEVPHDDRVSPDSISASSD